MTTKPVSAAGARPKKRVRKPRETWASRAVAALSDTEVLRELDKLAPRRFGETHEQRATRLIKGSRR